MSRSQPIDVRDMAIVHRTFRSAYAESARLVRAQPTPSAGRVTFVADHIDFGLEMLDHLNQVLQSHLDDEEQQVVPLAAVTLTQEEWDAVGEHSTSHIPRARRGMAFGMIVEPLDEDDRNFMKHTLPAPVRMLYPLLI